MPDTAQNTLIKLHEAYEKKPLLKALIQAVTIKELPVGAFADTMLSSYVGQLKAKKLQLFYQQLDNGSIVLTEELIASSDFLHAYFSTVNYVLRNRSDQKIKAFAEILKSLSAGQINIDQFEDYSQIFDELTEREFIILSMKYEFEKKHDELNQSLNPLKRTMIYWDEFKAHVMTELQLTEQELSSLLFRLQRTGCYLVHLGYYNDTSKSVGDTTVLLQKIIEVISYNII